MKLLVGTSGFGYKEWQGKFYPEKISPKDMLRFYAQRLPTVEINNTFYHQPTEAVLTAWAEQVPEDFIFAFKAPQVITHFKRLQKVDDETEYFFRTLSLLNQRLGPVLFQFPKSFKANLPALKDFLKLIPGYIACTFEFRSPSWLTAETFDLLRGRNFSLCTGRGRKPRRRNCRHGLLGLPAPAPIRLYRDRSVPVAGTDPGAALGKGFCVFQTRGKSERA